MFALARHGPRRESPTVQWRQAQAAWQGRPNLAAGYRAFCRCRRGQPEGREAQRRLLDAAAHYRRAIELIAAGQVGAREELARGKALAPWIRRCSCPWRAPVGPATTRSWPSSTIAASLPSRRARIPKPLRAAQRELSELSKELGDAYGAPPAAPPPERWLGRVQTLATLLAGAALGLLWRGRCRAISRGRDAEDRSLSSPRPIPNYSRPGLSNRPPAS